MKTMKAIISENTGISISLVITMAGGLVWLSTLYYKTEAIAQSVSRVELKQDQYNDNQSEIIQRLSRIEGALSRDRRTR